ncbi:MAG: hypothetical protein DMF53_23760 [Acidobacteria bacterium]|nr:MAG: hypothetical protein DMF53_23760 [Acidobacteriota bacterium]
MLRRGIHRIAIALVLAAALLAPAASLAAGPSRPAPSWRLGLDAFWAWANVWLGLPAAAGPTHEPANRKTACDGGSHIDPDGRTVCQPAAGTNSDGGLSIDPDGLKANSDGGLSIDPNG